MARPPLLEPIALDRALARGWYRMRQSMFTCRFLTRDTGLFSVVWTRLPLDTMVLRKSQRRRLNRIHRDLRVDVGPMVLDGEREQLYSRYRAHAQGDRAPSLKETLFEDATAVANLPVTLTTLDANGDPDPPGRNLFDTWEVRIRTPEGRLVGLSIFDRGQSALQSIVGIYDPEWARYGLGTATMLIEADWGRRQGFRHHYSGYVVPGLDSFEYKHDIGSLEALHPTGGVGVGGVWRPVERLNTAMLPAARLRETLLHVARGLDRSGVANQLRLYPPYRFVQLNRLQERALGEPLFLEVDQQRGGPFRLGVSMDIDQGTLQLDLLSRGRDISHMISDVSPDSPFLPEMHVLTRIARMSTAETPAEMVRLVRAVCRRSA